MLLDMLPKSNTLTELLTTCSTIRQAKEAIEKFQPKLLLLDVELPDGTGVDLLNNYEDVGSFETIFITSHDKYAIDAIKRNAADYIVKPVKQEDLNDALLKVHKRIEIYNKLLQHNDLNNSVEKLKSQNLQEKKIVVSTLDGAMFIKVSEIIMLESESNYSVIHLENNKKFLASKTLSVFEEMLENLNFMRIHRSFIVNLTKIKTIKCVEGNYSAIMEDNSKVEISRRKKKDFFEKISYQF
jgi:two-component system LytT family response regulator